MRTFEYRLYPNKAQRTLLMGCLIESRHMYNEMLAATKAQYAQTGKFLFKYELLDALCGACWGVGPGHDGAGDRLSAWIRYRRYLAFREQGIPIGFPRFKIPNRWHSIQLRQHKKDFLLREDGKHLGVPGKVGILLKIKRHRPIEGTPQTCHLVLRADGHWYALIVCAPAGAPQSHTEGQPCSHPDIGLDVGLKVFLADSEGSTVANPRYYRKSQHALRRKQRELCRRKKGSRRRREAARNCARTHLKIKRQRRDFLCKTAKSYAEGYARICVEVLNITSVLQNHHLTKSIADGAIGTFLEIASGQGCKSWSSGGKSSRPLYVAKVPPMRRDCAEKLFGAHASLSFFCGYVEEP